MWCRVDRGHEEEVKGNIVTMAASQVRLVNVYGNNGMAHAMLIQYQTRDGKLVSRKRHGRVTDDIVKIKLDCASEYLVGILGFYGRIQESDTYDALRSITFDTNKGKYGPFGDEIGTDFSSALSEGKIVAFHGRRGDYLDALGVHMEYF